MTAAAQLDLFDLDDSIDAGAAPLDLDGFPSTRDEAERLDAEIDDDDPRRCPCCGFPAFLDVVEAWTEERAFAVDSCCDANRDAWLGELANHDRRNVAAWFAARTGLRVRQVYVDEEAGAIRLDFGLELVEVSRNDAKAFVREHHRHHKPPAGDKYRLGVRNGSELVAVAMIGRPVARRLDDGTVLEVNRVCVDHGQHRALTWNACSLLYGAAAREAKRRGFRRIVTYLLETEDGASLRAAGWTQTATTRGGSWSRPSRGRIDSAPTCRKVRWERDL